MTKVRLLVTILINLNLFISHGNAIQKVTATGLHDEEWCRSLQCALMEIPQSEGKKKMGLRSLPGYKRAGPLSTTLTNQ